ncbi:MAG: hypothetical protein GQ540_03875 [Lutibacter sp.]|uniref:hypothetical protein n=1 Tax=Lutibacter sp. TaxID=1925666 RepID=UPI0019E93F0F|nr:hypothetical protein [Lutibacter sp.]NOR27652.1 hypothetical protein [Lutibacter sp.]
MNLTYKRKTIRLIHGDCLEKIKGLNTMAEFCKQCSIDMFGKDFGDFKYMGNGEKLKEGCGWQVLCEGCGPTFVDDEGVCIYPYCEKHKGSWLAKNITRDEKTKEYIGWNESQSIEVVRNTDRVIVCNELVDYANTLDRD